MYSQKYSVNVGVLQGCILWPTLSLLYINNLPDVANCNIYAAGTFLYSKCCQASGLIREEKHFTNANNLQSPKLTFLSFSQCKGHISAWIIKPPDYVQLTIKSKFVFAIFYQIFIFWSNNIGLQKLWKMYFISSKKLLSFSRYSNFCNFFPSFLHFQDSKGQMEVE